MIASSMCTAGGVTVLGSSANKKYYYHLYVLSWVIKQLFYTFLCDSRNDHPLGAVVDPPKASAIVHRIIPSTSVVTILTYEIQLYTVCLCFNKMDVLLIWVNYSIGGYCHVGQH